MTVGSVQLVLVDKSFLQDINDASRQEDWRAVRERKDESKTVRCLSIRLSSHLLLLLLAVFVSLPLYLFNNSQSLTTDKKSVSTCSWQVHSLCQFQNNSHRQTRRSASRVWYVQKRRNERSDAVKQKVLRWPVDKIVCLRHPEQMRNV